MGRLTLYMGGTFQWHLRKKKKRSLSNLFFLPAFLYSFWLVQLLHGWHTSMPVFLWMIICHWMNITSGFETWVHLALTFTWARHPTFLNFNFLNSIIGIWIPALEWFLCEIMVSINDIEGSLLLTKTQGPVSRRIIILSSLRVEAKLT